MKILLIFSIERIWLQFLGGLSFFPGERSLPCSRTGRFVVGMHELLLRLSHDDLLKNIGINIFSINILLHLLLLLLFRPCLATLRSLALLPLLTCELRLHSLLIIFLSFFLLLLLLQLLLLQQVLQLLLLFFCEFHHFFSIHLLFFYLLLSSYYVISFLLLLSIFNHHFLTLDVSDALLLLLLAPL